jgi:hypothetical protein
VLAKFLGTYSNGWGHFLFSVAIVAAMSVLLFYSKIDVAVFSSVVSPVVVFWFGAGVVNTTIKSQQKVVDK